MVKVEEKTEGKRFSLKEELFCQEWVDNMGNGTRAALVAYDIKGKEILSKNPPVEPEKRKTQELTDFQLEFNKYLVAKKKYHEEIKRVESVADSMACENLRKPAILGRIDKLLDERGFDDKTVKREHSKLLRQDLDYGVKMRAISDYYKLKGKYEEKAPEVIVNLIANKEKVSGLLDKI